MLGQGAAARKDAFCELYDRHAPRVYQYCAQILGNRELAQDYVQEAFLRLLQSADGERRMTNVPAFVLRIARNLCLNAKKALRWQHDELVEEHLPPVEQTVEARELEGLVQMALDLLSEDYREALILQTYGGLSYKEIAELMEIPLHTVRNRVVRAKQKLRSILLPYFADKLE